MERLQDWCGMKTIEKAKEIIKQEGAHLKDTPKSIKLSKNKKRWGSCSNKKIITLNPRLYQLPEIALKYVVIHELSHLIHLDHSAAFWKEVARLMPNYKEGQAALNERDFGVEH